MTAIRLVAIAAAATALVARAAPSGTVISNVYVNGEHGYPCFRQPVLLSFGSTVLAFVEGRNNTLCWGTQDGYPAYILVKR